MKICLTEKRSASSLAANYTIESASVTPELQGLWDGPAWGQTDALDINKFHPDTVSRHSMAQAKLLYDAEHVYVHFRVQDQHVQSFYTNFQDNVCRDSCVEFFFQPRPDKSYFNCEINCGGTLLLFYVDDHTRNETGAFKKHHPLPWELAKQVRIYHSMPRTTPQTIHEPLTWQIEAAIPFSILEPYIGSVPTDLGSPWRGNLYKCGGAKHFENYASWSPIGRSLNFHQPEFFGNLTIGK